MIEKSYTTYEIAQFCEVTIRAVSQWIDQGKLAAYRTPGGHRRVKAVDFLAFLKQFQMPVPPVLTAIDRPRILVVDDDKALLTLLKKALEKWDAKPDVALALDGFEAGEKIGTFLPDLVLLDIMLPGIDGLKVCKKIKGQTVKNIKVIAMTGEPTSEIKKQALACGADRFIAKPFELEKILQEVRQLLGFSMVEEKTK